MKTICMFIPISTDTPPLEALMALDALEVDAKFLYSTGKVLPVIPQLNFLGWGDTFAEAEMYPAYSRLIAKSDGVLILRGDPNGTTRFIADVSLSLGKPVFDDIYGVLVWCDYCNQSEASKIGS